MNRIVLLMPFWNVVGYLRLILPRIVKWLFSQVVVVDFGLVDGLSELCKEHEAEFFRQSRRVVRYDMKDYSAFITNVYEYSRTFSPDEDCDSSILPKFDGAHLSKVQLVMESRYADGTSSDDYDFLTPFGNRFFMWSTNLLLKTNFHNVLSVYRTFKPNLVRDLI